MIDNNNLNNIDFKSNQNTILSTSIKFKNMVENSGIEPLTSYVQGRRSPS